MRTVRSILLFTVLTILASPWKSSAQRSAHVRVFRPAGSYPANITVAPSGAVLSRSGDSPNLLILDGYTRREVAMAVETPYRVHQSRSSQLWSVTRDGLQLQHRNEWSLHPIPEIRNELANNPIRQLRQISILPAEVNHVFILLSDRLLDYDSGTREIGVLKFAREAKIGEFLEIQEGPDETIWISGTFGFARVQGPMRRITAETPWEEYVLPDTNSVNTLQRPFEFPKGTVTASANTPTGDGTRFVVQLKDGEFDWFPVPAEKIKQSWSSWDNSIWGYSSTTLFRIENDPVSRLRKEPVSGAQYDMGLETNGVFWVASSEGLFRYAPHLWRPPTQWQDFQSSIHALTFERTGEGVWAASPEGLIHEKGGTLQIFPWPEAIESLALPRDSLHLLVNGRVVVGAEGRPFVFDPGTRRFSMPQTPPGVQVTILGSLLDGTVCAWFESPTNDLVDLRRFDGAKFEPMPLPAIQRQGAELIVCIETAPGELWLGNSKGIIRVSAQEETVEYHRADVGLTDDRVTAIAKLADGKLFCGTTAHVFEFADGRWQRRLGTRDRVSGIASVNGSVWVGTAAGIYRSVGNSWIPNNANDGIPGDGVYALKLSPSDRLWAGTSRGLVVFNPDADTDPPRTWPPVLPDAVTPSTLEPTTILFRGNDKWDYTLHTELLYSYKLDENPWTPYSNLTSAVFHKLSSGAHVVEIRSMDRNGNQSSITSSIEFSVIVPWFQDPRLLVVTLFALAVTSILAGYATMKHFQLKRSYAEVEEIVRQRTGELQKANQELLHSQKMRAIGTMAAGIAHDFNNILSIIKGSAQIIEGNVEDKEKIKTRVNRIRTVVEQGTTIVKALLGLGRMNEQELSPCDAGGLLRETRKLLSDRFSAEVQFQVQVGNDLPSMICSKEVLQQMLLNFILNAVEAMGGKGLVTLSARATDSLPTKMILEPALADAYMLISVADVGVGIPAETLPRIFEPFFTTKGFSSRRGTGLGLSMVYELAKGLGYGVTVESILGKGSTFSIIVPLRPDQEKAAINSEALEGRS